MKEEILIKAEIKFVEDNYYISEEGVFPDLKPTCVIENMQSGEKLIRVWCEQSLVYSGNGRNDSWSRVVELLEQTQTQTIPIGVTDVRGGLLSIKCFVTLKDRANRTVTVSSNVITFTILAKQPVKKNVRNLLNHKYLQVAVYQRSAFEQFTASGEPVFDKGFGLYRIVNPTVAEIWNWKVNAENAITDFKNRMQTVSTLPEKLRTEDPVLYKGLPDFTVDQLELETLQSYGEGGYHVPKKSGIIKKWKWVNGAQNDGFADKCLVILKAISVGNMPIGWD